MIMLTILAVILAAIYLFKAIVLLCGGLISIALFGDILIAILFIWLIVRIIQYKNSKED